jgi:hypothetical protein
VKTLACRRQHDQRQNSEVITFTSASNGANGATISKKMVTTEHLSFTHHPSLHHHLIYRLRRAILNCSQGLQPELHLDAGIKPAVRFICDG